MEEDVFIRPNIRTQRTTFVFIEKKKKVQKSWNRVEHLQEHQKK